MLDLRGWAYTYNYKIAWGNIGCLNESLSQFQIMSQTGDLNNLQNEQYHEWTAQDYSIENSMNKIILIAYSTSGKTRQILFDFNDMVITALLPPCYGDEGLCWQYEMTIEKSLADYLLNYGYKVKRLSGPYKNLAARLGLGRYGRNNLIYVEGFGSYIRMVGFITDAELTPEFYPGLNTEKSAQKNCEKCTLCKINCPTHAIDDDRFLLHVDRCLAYRNEKADEWPDFIKTSKNNCLVGCLICQNVCPYNKDFTNIGTKSSERFCQKETDYILGTDIGDVSNNRELVENLSKKIKKLGLSRYNEYILRNIRAYIKNLDIK